jgi:poly(A) polymerase
VHHLALNNLSELSRNFSESLLQALQQTAGQHGLRIYLVGGTVRDFLLGRISHDVDLAVAGSALTMAKLLQRKIGGGTLVDLSGPDDEAVRLVWQKEQVDISSFRAGVQTIVEDLSLRDFTINAMAVELPGLIEGVVCCSLIDPTGGLLDLRNGRVRHCPGAFPADPVRMLRGYRLCASLGMHLDAGTEEAIRQHAPLIGTIAAERITYEMQLIFESPRTAETMWNMDATGLLRQLLPELYQGQGVEQPEFHHLDVLDHCFLALEKMETIIGDPDRFFPGHGARIDDYLKDKRVVRCLKWAALMHDIGKPSTKETHPDKNGRVTFYGHDELGREIVKKIAERAKWSRADTELVSGLVGMHMHPFHLCNVARDEQISKKAALKLCRRAEDSLTGLFLLAMSDSLASRGEKKPERMEEELVFLFNSVLKMYDENIGPVLHGPRLLTGRDLIEECNLCPGPLFSDILDELETARVEGKIADRRQALAWVAEFLETKNRRKAVTDTGFHLVKEK